MTTRTGGDLDALAALRRAWGRGAWDLEDEAVAVAWRLDRFRDGSSEYVPPLPPHGARIRDLAQRLGELGDEVDAAAAALAAADRWVGVEVGRRVGTGVLAALDAHGAVDGTVRGARGTWAMARRRVLDARHPGEWGHAEVRARFFADRRGPRASTAEVRALRSDLNARNAALRQTLDRADDAAATWLDDVTPQAVRRDVATDLRNLAGRLDDGSVTRLRSVTRLGSRVLAVAGPVLGAHDMVQGAREGDDEQMITGGIAMVAGTAMFVPLPPVQLAAAVVSGGLLVWEFRDEIADVGHRLLDEARREVEEKVALVTDTAEAVGDMASAAWDAVKGLF